MKFKSLLSLAAFTFALLQCTSSIAGLLDAFDSSSSNRETLSAVEDRPLVDQFYALSEDAKEAGLAKDINPKSGYKLIKLTPSSLTIRTLYFTGNNLGEIRGEMRQFAVSPTDDAIGKRYLAFAQSRGNLVKQYKPAMGEALNRMFEQHFEFKPAPNVVNFLGAENALIEYSPAGRIVSIMTKAHQAIHNYNSRSWQYINIYFGATNSQIVENKISNSLFADTFQRVVEPAAARVQ